MMHSFSLKQKGQKYIAFLEGFMLALISLVLRRFSKTGYFTSKGSMLAFVYGGYLGEALEGDEVRGGSFD